MGTLAWLTGALAREHQRLSTTSGPSIAPGGVRPLTTRSPLTACRLGQVRLLRLPLPSSVGCGFDTLKGQLDLERHGGHTPTGVVVRVLQRLLAMTTAIWHNDHTGQPIRRSLLAYNH